MRMQSEPADPRPRAAIRLRRWILPAIVSAVVLIPNLVVIALGVEDFPFTTAPMFAQYVGPETKLYALRLEGVRDGTAEPFPIEELNLSAIEFQRQMASWYYRPLTDTAPFRDLSGASSTPDGFSHTMAGYLGSLTDFLRDQRGISYDEVDLYVDIVDSTGKLLETDPVGRYDTDTQEYTQTYEASR
jgi:hypothetical protein